MTADAWDLWEYSRDSYDVAANNITMWLAVLQQDPAARRRYDDLRHVSLDVLTGSTDPSHPDRLSESDADDEHAPPPLSACVAARSLADATSFSDVYIEELKYRGGLQLLVKLLASSDEMVVEAAATVIANCSGPLAARPAVKGFTFGGVDIKVLEMSFSEGGLGWKVWGTAVMLARQLAASPALLRGKSVLDLGSGCGLTGLLAIKLGARSVCLTDCVPPVLHNLTVNVIHLPAQPLSSPSSQTALPPATSQTPKSIDSPSNSVDASVLYTDFLYKGKDGNECVARIRYLEWAEDGGGAEGRGVGGGSEAHGDRTFKEQSDGAHPFPRLDDADTFERVIASDVIYQKEDVEPIVAVIKKRLECPGGECHIVHTVRSNEVFDYWIDCLRMSGMDVEVTQLPPPLPLSIEDPEVGGRGWPVDGMGMGNATTHGEEYYEGGFVAMKIWHACPTLSTT